MARIVAEAEAATLERRVHPAPGEGRPPGQGRRSCNCSIRTCSTDCRSGDGGRYWTRWKPWRRRITTCAMPAARWNWWRGEAQRPEVRPFFAERYELESHSGLSGGLSTATVTIRTGDHVRTETEDGDGAVNALERALRQCLFAMFPEIAAVHMAD